MSEIAARVLLAAVNPRIRLPPFEDVRNNDLCSQCAALSIPIIVTPNGQPHVESLRCLYRSAQLCPLCNLFALSVFLGFHNRRTHLSTLGDNPLICRVKSIDEISSIYLADNRTPAVSLCSTCIELRVFSAEDDLARGSGINLKRLLTRTDSQQSFEKARQWIAECLTNHNCSYKIPSSNDNIDATYCPTRLIKLRHDGTRSEGEVYLISPSEYCKYVALSYCWGNPIDASWVTTIDNLSSRQSRLRLEELPQTLRQAVAITQGLGYDYLWVDAICIVQDSLIDWEHESARMGSVYGNSFVTIAATSSASSSDGIYNIRSSDQGEQHDRIIKISTLVGGHQSVLHICCWSDAETREDEDCPHQIRNGSLSQRGWALQERLFSPRTIHYTSDQLFWECRRCYVAEDGLYLQPCFTGHSIINGGYTLARDLMAITQVPPSETEFAATWHWYERIVTPFTKRTLTRSTDKLVAVSDIARAVHDSTGATYHAGIWLASIQFGLCWRFKRPRAQSVEYRCPSYCWATYDGEIEWPIGIYDVTLPPADFIVVAHNIDTESLDAFGSVTGGYLDLFGQLKPAIVLPLMGDEEIDRGNRNVGLWDSNGHQAIPCEPFNGSFVEYDSDVTEDIDVFCFLLCSSQEELPEKIWTAWILLIQPTGDEDTFKRVGLASLWARSKGSWFDDASRRRFRIV